MRLYMSIGMGIIIERGRGKDWLFIAISLRKRETFVNSHADFTPYGGAGQGMTAGLEKPCFSTVMICPCEGTGQPASSLTV